MIVIREKGPQRPVNKASGQGFPLARPADVTSKIVSRDSPACIGHLLILDGERKKVDPLSNLIGRNNGHQDHRFSKGHDGRTASLSGYSSCFYVQCLPVNIYGTILNHWYTFPFAELRIHPEKRYFLLKIRPERALPTFGDRVLL